MKQLLCIIICLFYPLATKAVETSGEYTQLLIQTRDSLNQDGFTDLNRLRLTGEGSFKQITWKISYDHELLYGALVRDPQFRIISSQPEQTYIDASADLHQGHSLNWKHSLYRSWLKYENDIFSLTLGRQRVAWGSGRIWNPSDRFNPVSPTALEPSQKLGVDALNTVLRYGNSGSIQLISAPGKTGHNVLNKKALRWQDTFDEMDVAIMGGIFGNEHVFALDLTGNIGEGGGRMELLRSTAGANGAYTQLSVGYDYTLTRAPFQNGLYMAVEYFYNSASPDISGQQADHLSSLNRSLWGAQLGYDLTPLWRLDVMVLADWTHQSLFYSPRLLWSMQENLDMTLLAQWIQKGASGGEFSALNHLYAIELEWYF